MKKLFTLLVIFTFFVSALSVAQIMQKGDKTKVRNISLNKSDYVKKDLGNNPIQLEQNQSSNPIFVNTQGLSPDALITIGSGTTTGNYPFYMYWGYTRSASLYKSAEIGSTGNITTLGWYVSTSSATNCPIKIYLKTTTSTTLTTGTWANLISGATLVYDASNNFSTTGWKTITLTLPFNYTADNLLVLCEANYGGAGASSYPIFYKFNATSTHETWTADNTPPSGNGTVANTRPQIQLNISAATPSVPTVATNSVAFASSTTATTGGNVTYDGLSTVTARGVCWNTSGNPTVSDNITSDGSGTGTFSSTITGLSIGQTYYVKAYATNTTGTGYGSQVVYTHIALTPPFTENFDGVTSPALPAGWKMENTNGDAYTWGTNTLFPNSAPNSMYIRYNSSLAMNDWFFTPPVYLQTGKTYQISFQYTGDGTYPEKLEVKYGTSQTATGMTSSAIFSNTNILNSAYTLGSGTMSVGSDGYYYFGWHGFSAMDEDILLVDDITVQEAVNNDLLVDIAYVKGKIPLNYGANDVIKATVRNVGLATQTNVNVTLDITNSNTYNNVQTIASLAPGASTTVTFAEFVATATGTDNVTVSVPDDENNSNNSKSFTQEVTTNTDAYSDGSAATTSLGWGTGSGTFLCKYHATGNAIVDYVNAFISTDPATTGNTIYGVVLNTSGTIVGQSANYVIQATDLGTWKTFTITSPPDVSNVDYYVGFAQTANAVAYYPLGTQTESPGRPAAFYSTAITGGTFTERTTFGRFMIEAVLSTPVNMVYVSSTTVQTTGKVYLNSTNQQIMSIQVVTSGTSSPLTATDFALNTNGTSDPTTDITNAKIFYTGTNSTFTATGQFGTTVANPIGSYNITGSQALSMGTNYFWLTYDIPSGATNGNSVDAECTQILIGKSRIPTVTAPPEHKTIAGTMSGTYAIGSGTFNKVTGKNLHQVEKTKMVRVLVPVDEKSDKENIDIKMNSKEKGNFEQKANKFIEKMIEEKYYTMYDGNKPYDGTLFVRMSELQSRDKEGTPRMSPDSYDEVFADITTAISELNARGIIGPVTFEFTDASYTTSAVTLNAVTGASATNTITFKPKTGVTVDITGSSATGIFNINGADYVTFDGSNSGGSDKSMTITNTNTASGTYGINFSGTGNDYNTIKNCNIKSEYRGINIANATTTLIENNNIYGNASGNANSTQAGIYVGTGSINTVISKNVIHDFFYTGTSGFGTFGIYYASDATTVTNIINNIIHNIKAGGDPGSISWDASGIYIYSGGNIKIYNNSIYMSGDVLGAGTYNGWSSCISVASGITLLDIKNNALRNSMGRIPAGTTAPVLYAIYSSSANSAFTDINYNDYYVSDQANVTEYIGFLTSARTNLTAWQSATGKDAYSVSGNPGFTSNTDLTPNTSDANSWVLSGNGIHLSGVTTDYAGNTRPADVIAGAPDIGAYEFTAGASVPNSFVITPISGSNDILVNGRKLINLYFSNLGGISSIDVKYYSGINPPGTSGFPVMNGYFVITPTGGSGFVYDITYFYSEPQRGGVVDETLIRLSKSDNGGTNWIAYTAPGTGQDQYILDYTTTNSIKVHQLSTFSTFTNGGGDAPLPVTLSSFSSSSNGRDVKLMWKTEKEINNSGFDVERKTDGSNLWSKVGYVKGSGSTNLPVNYTFEDKKLNSGKYNYRLKQIDYNGNFEYHNLTSGVDVALPTKFNLSQNYPNPFNPITKIDFDLPFDSKVNIVLYDMTGREVKTLVNESRTAGFHTVTFNASVLSSGTYFYRIITKSSAKDFIATKKMVLIK